MDRLWLKHYDPEVPPSIDYPHIPLYRILDDNAGRHPDRPCTCFMGKRLSYRQIKDLSDRFAAAIRNLGVAKGDRAALVLPNSPQFIISYYGLLKAGAVVVPLNPLCTEYELAFHLSDCGAKLAVTIPLFTAKLAAVLD